MIDNSLLIAPPFQIKYEPQTSSSLMPGLMWRIFVSQGDSLLHAYMSLPITNGMKLTLKEKRALEITTLSS